MSRVIDRDDRTDDEIHALQCQQIRVLSRRTIESYLLDDAVLQSMCEALEQPELAPQLLQAKADALRNSVANGGPADDLKRPAGDIYNAAKRVFPARKLGSDKRAFMKGFARRGYDKYHYCARNCGEMSSGISDRKVSSSNCPRFDQNVYTGKLT